MSASSDRADLLDGFMEHFLVRSLVAPSGVGGGAHGYSHGGVSCIRYNDPRRDRFSSWSIYRFLLP
mgnify:CR=1 FL=1